MKDKGVALSRLGNRAPFIKLNPEQEKRVQELIAEIEAIFQESIRKAG